MKIYTKTGDCGETSLCNGRRVKKTDKRVSAAGAIDELNCVLGEVAATALIEKIQRDLFVIGSILAEAGVKENLDVKFLEKEIDKMESELPKLKDFILPGGTPLAAKIHTARAVCRRAEREVCGLVRYSSHKKTTTLEILQYLNRLSDLLFVLARYTNMKRGHKDIRWH